jgi:ribosomal protein L29
VPAAPRDDRLDRLEREVAELRAELAALRAELGA